MEKNGKIYISQKYRKTDYKNLNLELNSDEEKWETAINIFEDRIYGRYFKSIDILLNNNDLDTTGFAIMAINCLLVETLYQFKEGLKKTEGNNRTAYTNFLNEIMPIIFEDTNKSKMFYKDIRCGILHSAQTTNGSQLTYNKNYVVELFDNNKKIRVDIINFSKEIRNYYEYYVRQLKNPEETNSAYNRESMNTRLNFIKKMNYICEHEDVEDVNENI
nr:hypothetical protein [uncultured Faecalibacillus sp.]